MYNDVLFFILSAFVEIGCSGEEHVAAGVEGCLHGILYDADDEAYSYHLHGHIVADAKGRARHGNEQQ